MINNYAYYEIKFNKEPDIEECIIDNLQAKEHVIKNHLISKVANRCLIELIIASTIVSSVVFFSQISSVATAAAVFISYIAISVLSHTLSAGFNYYFNRKLIYAAHPKAERQSIVNSAAYDIQSLIPHLHGTLFAVFYENFTGTLIHEIGHALAAFLLFSNSGPEITITPLSGGMTRYNVANLTLLGQAMGRIQAKVIVAAAGPALAIFSSAMLLIAANAMKKKELKELSYYCKRVSIRVITSHVLYALSSFLSSSLKKRGHDFIFIWRIGGIHPIAAVVAMVSFPLLFNCIVLPTESWNL